MKVSKFRSTKYIVIAVLATAVIFPLGNLFLNINMSDFFEIINSYQFRPMMMNSIITTLMATIISIALAFSLAWVLNRTNIKYKNVFSVLFTLPMLIPSISHGMGLVVLFGDNGILTNALGINIGLFGYKGIIIGAVLYSFPVAFILLNNIFHYEDYTSYEAAEVLGLSKMQIFMKVTIPNLKPTLISTFLAIFTMIFTDYGVPLTVGGKVLTLPVYMYREVVGLMNFSKGAIIGVILLIPAVVAFVIDLRSDTQANSSTITQKYKIQNNVLRDFISQLFVTITVILTCLPIFTFMYLMFVTKYPVDMSITLENIYKAGEVGIAFYLLNSLTIAFITAFVGTMVSYGAAYLTARSKKVFSTVILHLFSMLSLAVPGLVLGLSYVLFFKGTFIYQTVWILILVNIVHFFTSPYLLAYNTLQRFSSNLEDISESLGISSSKMLMDVYVPSTKETIIEMFSYLFVNSMVTISAISFLANFRNMPLSLLIPQLDSQMMLEVTAFISILILIVNIIVKFITYIVKKFVFEAN